jgi:hypothetical protein
MTFVAVSATATRPAGALRLRWVTEAGGRLVMSWATGTTTGYLLDSVALITVKVAQFVIG